MQGARRRPWWLPRASRATPQTPLSLEAARTPARTAVTASKRQVRQPIDGRFVQRWRSFEELVRPLMPLP